VPFRVPIEDLRFGPNPPAGMNPLVLMSLTYRLKATREDPAPVLVQRDGDGWRVTDGRHRALAAMVAGRPDVLVQEHNPTWEVDPDGSTASQ
jgi:hypothetical protein